MRQLWWIGLGLGLVQSVGGAACAAELVWERRSTGLAELDARCVVAHPSEEGRLVAGTDRAVYRSGDGGRTWQAGLRVPGERAAVHAVAFHPAQPELVFAGTAQGLWLSRDGGDQWSQAWTTLDPTDTEVFATAVTRVSEWFRERERWLIGTGGGLWRSDDAGRSWQMIPALPRLAVHAIVIDPIDAQRWVVGTSRGIWVSEDAGAHWRRVGALPQGAAAMIEDTTSEDRPEETEEPASVHDLVVTDTRWYAATSAGLWMSDDRGGEWRQAAEAALNGLAIRRLLWEAGTLYLATSEGVWQQGPTERSWIKLAKGFTAREARWLTITHSETTLWSATDQGIFTAQPELNVADLAAREAGELLQAFAHEPTIEAVQAKAIAYAEVSSEKIRGWREAAGKKAWWPTLSVGADYDEDTTITSATSSGVTRFAVGPEDRSAGFDVGLSWNLGELVWNDDQTSIDVRSRLMVQLRDDILDEVNRVYFERRRLQLELLIQPPQDLKPRLEKELRIQELTAGLDALTGGWFSRELASRPRQD